MIITLLLICGLQWLICTLVHRIGISKGIRLGRLAEQQYNAERATNGARTKAHWASSKE